MLDDLCCSAEADFATAGVELLELLRGIRRFVSSYAFNLPSQFFIERVSAAIEVVYSAAAQHRNLCSHACSLLV